MARTRYAVSPFFSTRFNQETDISNGYFKRNIDITNKIISPLHFRHIFTKKIDVNIDFLKNGALVRFSN